MLGISKKEKKPEEPQYYMSRVQMPVMNYKVYHMGKVEKILTFMLAFVIGAAVAYLFYGGLFNSYLDQQYSDNAGGWNHSR